MRDFVWSLPDREAMVQRLLIYYDANGRDLPWRGVKDLYRIWVAEIMLQQTGVKTVWPYYLKFLARFPDIGCLAAASEEEVLSCWQGLGYYRRARHLHAAACRVVGEMAGRMPETLEGLVGLPGIGVSTAGAILAIGLNQPQAILDGNVKRVLSRLVALEHEVDSVSGRAMLWGLARHLTPVNRSGDYAQAIMDLGSEICRLRQPDCGRCPWSPWCQALAMGRPEGFPVVAPKGVKPHKFQFKALIFRDDGSVLLLQRPARGLLGGMWEPPGDDFHLSTDPPDPDTVRQVLADSLGLQVTLPMGLPLVRHVFTHFRLTVFPFSCHWLGGEPGDVTPFRWVVPQMLSSLPISTLHRKVLARGL
ncbi:MAG: A/G-specific adenine glycosylase [Magnetococcus sp. YQC-5]